jgi:chorismate dehydratase
MTIRVAAVSYLNTKPLLYGIEHSSLLNNISLITDYPSQLAKSLLDDAIDVALLPVAAMPGIPGAHIISDYGIATEGNVASVALFSQVPMEKIERVYLDYQSRTSVRLAQVLLREHWKKDVVYLPAEEGYIEELRGTDAGVIIGDRALQQLNRFPCIYDLATAWKDFTGLDFVFAAWVANKELPADFRAQFNEANAEGLKHIDDVIALNPCPFYDLHTYYTENIKYYLDGEKLKGMERFLEMIQV